MMYQVTVYSQGSIIDRHLINAPDGLAAINQVELMYGEPARAEYVTVELETGQKRNKMVVHNWHGLTFLAEEQKTKAEKYES